MSEPLKVFDGLEDLTPTELWSAIEHRQAGPGPEPPVSRSRRITVIGVAFAIAAVAIVLPVVAIVRAQEPAPLDQGASRHGVARSPMGLPIVVTFPPDWYAENVSQPASLDPAVDSGTQVGIVMSTSQEAMPPALIGTATSESAGALPDDPNLPAGFVTVTILAIEGRLSTGTDSELPLSMDDAQIAPGVANIRILDAQIGRVPLTITVQGGPQASDADLAAADAIVASIRQEDSPDPSVEGPISTPNVTGLTLDEALTVLQSAGLKTVVTRRPFMDVPAGSVISTEPAAGTDVDPGSIVTLSVSSGADVAGPVSLPGIDVYRVCRVLSLPGDFGEAGDEVVVFEEERVPGAGCVGSEGFQHVAVLRDGRVTALSRRITDVYPDDVWKVWPYATPDLDGDGVDEIAVALAEHETNRRLWFFMLGPGGGGVDAIYDPREPFTHVIGDAGSEPTSFEPRGIYCDGNGDARRIVTWEATGEGMLDVIETRWHLEMFRAVFDSETTIHIGERGYPDAGDTELCGSPVSSLDGYPG